MPRIFRFKSIDFAFIILVAMVTFLSLTILSAFLLFGSISSPSAVFYLFQLLLSSLPIAVLFSHLSLDLDDGCGTIVVYDKKTKEVKHVFESDESSISALVNPFKINIFKNSVVPVRKVEDDSLSLQLVTAESDKKLNTHIKFTKQITDFNLYIKNQHLDFKAEFIDAYNKIYYPHDFSNGNDLSVNDKKTLIETFKTKCSEFGINASSVKINTDVLTDNWVMDHELNDSDINKLAVTQPYNKKRYISIS